MTTYLLDADVFIQAKNLHYGFDFCPAFWNWLDEQNDAEKVFSVERVGDEILAGGDELAEWARQRPGLFLPPDETMVPKPWRTESMGQWRRVRTGWRCGVPSSR